MYEKYYQLRADPFTLCPSGQAVYEHSSYTKARSYLEYAIHRGEGIAVVTGQPGTGKTSLVREIERDLNGSRTAVIVVTCQAFTARELVSHVSCMLGIKAVGNTQSTTFLNIQKALIHHRQQGRHILLVLDEAQSLGVEALEQARLLSSYYAADQPLIQIVLVGQPLLRNKILGASLMQLHQRIVASCDLKPMSAVQTKEYVIHRLTAVGWHGVPFIDQRVYKMLHGASKGIPRWINQIGSRLLLRGMLEKKLELGVEDVNSVINDLVDESLLPASVRATEVHAIHSSRQVILETEC